MRFAVGEPGTYAREDDRIFVISIWGDWKDSTDYRNALAINGMSWPYTERLKTTVGDTLRWHVVNAKIGNLNRSLKLLAPKRVT